MNQPSLWSTLKRLGSTGFIWITSWWKILLFGVVVLSQALTPSTYNPTTRRIIASQIVSTTLPNLMWFTVLSTLISVVLIKIVVVTAMSYGLSQFAIEMVVRVLVLELIPMTAAMFVALRCTLPDAAEVEQMRAQGILDSLQRQGIDPIGQEFLPRIVAGVFAVWMLAIVSCIMTLVLAYLAIYGFTPWALPGYTRSVGNVFTPAVTLIMWMKIFFFSLAVSFIPMASAYYDKIVPSLRSRASLIGMTGIVRLFAVVLMIEVVSLMGNYY